MYLTTDAKEIHRHFSRLPGSDHIAKEHCVRGLITWLKRREPKNILEIGAGIGTLTFTTLAAQSEIYGDNHRASYKLTSVEKNEFCLSELKKNLSYQWTQFEVIEELPRPPAKVGPFDFVIIDGGDQNPNFVSNLSQRAVVFIEGYMSKKHWLIADTHKDRKWISTNIRSLNRKAGYWIFQFEPTVSERMWFTANNLCNRLYSGTKRRLPSVFRRAVELPVASPPQSRK